MAEEQAVERATVVVEDNAVSGQIEKIQIVTSERRVTGETFKGRRKVIDDCNRRVPLGHVAREVVVEEVVDPFKPPTAQVRDCRVVITWQDAAAFTVPARQTIKIGDIAIIHTNGKFNGEVLPIFKCHRQVRRRPNKVGRCVVDHVHRDRVGDFLPASRSRSVHHEGVEDRWHAVAIEVNHLACHVGGVAAAPRKGNRQFKRFAFRPIRAFHGHVIQRCHEMQRNSVQHGNEL